MEYGLDNASIVLFTFEVSSNSPYITSPTPKMGSRPLDTGEIALIPLYAIIFLLAVVGNILVIVTLVQNRRMRTVTNVFLLNLSISDLLLAVLCMPMTLIPTLLRDFAFGKVMCVAIRYAQGVSVAVSVFTLVAISLERYFAICQPLKSRSWQTLSHSYKVIVLVWFVSLLIMIPTAVCQKLLQMSNGKHKCIERWSNPILEKVHTVVLDVLLLLGPLVLMLVAYSCIAATLYRGIQQEMQSCVELTTLRKTSCADVGDDEEDDVVDRARSEERSKENQRGSENSGRKKNVTSQALRHTHVERSLAAKRRVVRMLFVLVLEFFICWTPVYVLQTWAVLDFQSAVSNVSPLVMSLFHLLSYVSSCCNPITYCFMNRRFRQGFLTAFSCCTTQSSRGNTWRLNSSMVNSQKTVFSSVRGVPTYQETDRSSYV